MKGKRKGILLLAGGMVICMSAVLAGGIKWSQSRSEKSVVKAAAAEVEESSTAEKIPYWSGWVAGAPYREATEDEEIGRQVCDKYGLDYETVTMGDVTREMQNYEEALVLQKTMGDKPLLEENITDNESEELNSLEAYIDKEYFFAGGKEVIEGFCKDAGITPEHTRISELTTEQLIEILVRVYNSPERPKGYDIPDDFDVEAYKYLGRWTDGTLYRDVNQDQDIVKQVCEKYGLDYETVTMKQITREMRNYEEALDLIKNMGDKPLLAEYATDEPEESAALESLEIYIDDIYAFDGGKKVIEEVCNEENINPAEAVISDLTVEQLIEIGEQAYNTSDHPKG